MNNDSSPLHEGEIALQERAGVHERMDKVARVAIRDHMPDQHREFFEMLPTIIIGAQDSDGHPMASMLAGEPGFMRSPDPQHLQLAVTAADDDPVLAVLAPGAKVGLLGLQPHTRRRNRMNGTVVTRNKRGLEVAVDQSFGNCPKYIQGREPDWRRGVEAPELKPAVRGGPLLSPALQTRIALADTFFIASAAPSRKTGPGAKDPYGVDVSHRGGRPGFVHVSERDGHSLLTVPDFIGNFFFNTLGNLALNPNCGLLFVDYEDGGLLHVRARAYVIWDGPEVSAVAGAQRLLKIEVDASLWRPAALPLVWTAPEFSNHLPVTEHPAGDAR